MPHFSPLVEALNGLGISATVGDVSDGASGYPVVLELSEGPPITFDLPAEAVFAGFDPETCGVAVLGGDDRVRARWGAAAPFVGSLESRDQRPIALASLLRNASRGVPGSIRIEGFRLSAAPMPGAGRGAVCLLVQDAREEEAALIRAAQSELRAEALKSIGKALTMNQTLQPLAVAAVHAIASAAELAAVLLWARTSDDGPMELVSSTGVNRAGAASLATLDTVNGLGCAAELSATRHQALVLRSIEDSPLTADLEAKFCYLKPGGLMVLPLTIGDRLIGMLEIVSREGDPTFVPNQDLFLTIAEHLALALNSAVMFEQMERLAAFDPLTGIANHRTMQEFLHQRVSESQRTGQPLGVVMLDVDHFRHFNEEEGHDAGDQVLRQVADVLKSALRPYDLAARYGGEEFTLILPGSSGEEAIAIAERIRGRVAQIPYTTREGATRNVTASLGIAAYPETATDPASLLKAADLALYRAKRSGRNRSVLFEGRYAVGAEREAFDPASLDALIGPEDQDAASVFATRVATSVAHLARELDLSAHQVRVLQGAVRLTPSWLRTAEQPEDRERLARAPEARLLLPLLEALDGPGGTSGTVPLLGRILVVLAGMFSPGATEAGLESGRFDPEIVALIGAVEEAA